MTVRLILISLFFLISCRQENGDRHRAKAKHHVGTPSVNDFIFLAWQQSDTLLGDVNQFISDVKEMPNISRPKRSIITDSRYPLKSLYGVWGGGPDEPAADFELDSSRFLVADYDG